MCLCHLRFNIEDEDRSRMHRLSWPQQRRRKLRMIWRIRKVLRLQAKTLVPCIVDTVPPCISPVERVTRVKLDSWFRRDDSQQASACRIVYLCGQLELVILAIQNEILVITACELELLVASSIRRPTLVASRKSGGVPATAATPPVGINSELVGVYRSAFREPSWSRMSPASSPFKLK